MAMVFQNVEDALDPVQRIQDQVAEAILVHRNVGAEIASREAAMHLNSVGLSSGKARMYPHQLSGGEKQRVLIAMALVNDPDLLILDEPTASLDALTKADIIRLFQSATLGRICIVITHDLSLAASLTEKMAVLYAGQVMEMGRTEELLRNPRHPYTRGLIKSLPKNGLVPLEGSSPSLLGLPEGCFFKERCTSQTVDCVRRHPQLSQNGGWMKRCILP